MEILLLLQEESDLGLKERNKLESGHLGLRCERSHSDGANQLDVVTH